MTCSIDTSVARFTFEQQLAGEYVLDDPFKPHFRTLRTPAGHETVMVSPGDHRHHKGLMYALVCADLSFWEEDAVEERCGRQEILRTDPLDDGSGLRQELLWRSLTGARETYREVRTICCHRRPDGSAFVWQWTSEREALRDHELVMSPWSEKLPDGRRINYHGLGVRLPWMWRFPGEWAGAVEVDGRTTDPVEACGSTGPAVGFWGLIDGQWQPTRAAVTIRQQQDFTWFVLKGDFPYLSVGPSNARPVQVNAGEQTRESYTIIVEDRPAPPGRP